MEMHGYELKSSDGSSRKLVSGSATSMIHEPHPQSILNAYKLRKKVDFFATEGTPAVSQTMSCKEYDGSVLLSAEDNLLHGRIVGIRDLVSYDGKKVRTL